MKGYINIQVVDDNSLVVEIRPADFADSRTITFRAEENTEFIGALQDQIERFQTGDSPFPKSP